MSRNNQNKPANEEVVADAVAADAVAADAVVQEEKEATKTVEFIFSPTGAYGLAYSIGEVAELPANQADELIDAGFAIVYEEKSETPEAAE